MGADIHMFVERAPLAKRRDEIISSLLDVEEFDINANWELIGYDVYGSRNYDLIGRLTNVITREGVVPLSEPRGVPKDASKVYKKECKGYWKGHSHSYFYLSELVKEDWIDISQEMHELVERLKTEYKDLDTIRIVFFFDN
jgi:hypothetical protein